MITLERLTLYPVKSMGGMDVKTAYCDKNGLKGDRQFIIANTKGGCITAREKPQLLTLHPRWNDDFTAITIHGNGPVMTVSRPDPAELHELAIWDDTADGVDCGDTIADWLTDFLGTPARLLSIAGPASRHQKCTSDTPQSYADLMPLLLLSSASVEMINTHLEKAVSARNFRPNILLAGVQEGFAEDFWQTLRVGNVVIDQVLGCSRCVMTTADPDTGVFDKHKEPMKTLGRIRRGRDKRIYVGQNGAVRHPGTLHIGDTVTVAATRDDNICFNDLFR